MIGRCTQPSSAGFAYYQKLGITVCHRWRYGDGERSGFECFLADLGERPSIDYTLDRYPNKLGSYEPNNCRWATRAEQSNNLIINNIFDLNGEKLTIREISNKTGLSYEILRHRLIRAGWSVEDAINPKIQKGQRGIGRKHT